MLTQDTPLLNPAIAPIDLLIGDLIALDADLTAAARRAAPRIERVDPAFRRSATNLVQYLEFRKHDVRHIQDALADLGLSSLGRAEAHVQATLRSVIGVLHTMVGRTWSAPDDDVPVSLHDGSALLARHTELLLGPPSPDRHARIMVTASTDLATDPALMQEMVRAGMDILRINCAHDNEQLWSAMIEHLRSAEQATGRPCRIIMDLPGPKLRTGPVTPGPAVIKWRPRRDPYGHVVEPARIWLTGSHEPAPAIAAAALPVAAEWLDLLTPGQRITFRDTRGAKRSMRALHSAPGGWWAESVQTSYVAAGTELNLANVEGAAAAVEEIPASAGSLHLQTGDTLIVTRSLAPGEHARTLAGATMAPARIGCTLPAIFDSARPGERIVFDDGKIGGVIVAVNPDEIQVEVTRAGTQGARLRGEKGINLPDTSISVPALTEADLSILPFVVAHADMIDYSFVRSAEDVELLHQHLDALGLPKPGVVLKIETRRAFERLPEIILEAMREHAAGIMIARGDLAVEIGYERLAEVQEEILWIAEAAHLPVIWATQVLETLAQTGQPSRSEITDAAMGERAECVMLNKGPHVVEAIDVLDNILQRMEDHQSKKRTLLRRLRSWNLDDA